MVLSSVVGLSRFRDGDNAQDEDVDFECAMILDDEVNRVIFLKFGEQEEAKQNDCISCICY